MAHTHVDYIKNDMSSGHISYNDKQDSGVKQKAESGQIAEIETKIPEWFWLQSNFDKYHVHITSTATNKEHWLWEHDGVIRIHDKKPGHGDYTAGNKLCDSGGHISLTVEADGSIKDHYLYKNRTELFAERAAIVATILASNGSVIENVCNSTKAFYQSTKGSSLLDKMTAQIGLHGNTTTTNYPTEILAQPGMSSYTPGYVLKDQDGNDKKALTVTFMSNATCQLGAGISGVSGEGFDNKGDFGSIVQQNLLFGTDLGFEVSFEIGFWFDKITNLSGSGGAFVATVSADEGLYMSVNFDSEGGVQGIVVGFCEGVDVAVGGSFGVTSINAFTPSSS